MSNRAETLLRRGLPSAVFLVLVLLLVLVASAQAFPDVPAGHAYKTAIDRLSQSGIIGGYRNGDFGLNDPVKRAQFAKMIVGALEIAPSSSTSTRFTDLGAPDANGYPHKYVQAAYDNGITTGTNATQTLFAPWNSIRRDQVVSMIVRGIERLHPSLLEDPPGGEDRPVHRRRRAARAESADRRQQRPPQRPHGDRPGMERDGDGHARRGGAHAPQPADASPRERERAVDYDLAAHNGAPHSPGARRLGACRWER